ncbi:hypothetical protein PI95_017845 [Hassallia byssoidea VB512170]|uniref:Uncharacterized protein n=1 Tax=Hassallia byssoidea VB512170 TaxID=1304833 RepID=A0A846HAL4_9CYAN|nr:hypothetical protein [Hassalia byssoidea]NEU74372.1 hypothetical protein [Hassalia byssoidea VB512170]
MNEEVVVTTTEAVVMNEEVVVTTTEAVVMNGETKITHLGCLFSIMRSRCHSLNNYQRSNAPNNNYPGF